MLLDQFILSNNVRVLNMTFIIIIIITKFISHTHLTIWGDSG